MGRPGRCVCISGPFFLTQSRLPSRGPDTCHVCVCCPDGRRPHERLQILSPLQFKSPQKSLPPFPTHKE